MMYNRFFSLRLNLAMKLILVFLCKDFFLMAVVGATAFKGKGGADVSQLMALVHPIFFLADFPAVAVIYAACVRQPDSGELPRLIWRHGRELILLSTAIYCTLVIYGREWQISSLSWADGAALTVNAAIIVYLLRSEYVRDLFADFPISKSPNGSAPNGS